MTKPIDIIETHRKDLIRRLLKSNPLLGFRPATGGRIDFHDLFSVSEIDSGNTGEPEQLLGFRPTTQGQIGFHDSSPAPDIDSGNTGDPKRFLQDIVKGGKAKIDMSHGSMKKFLAPLRRLKLRSLDNFRATGSWSLCLGWPLVLIPGGKNSPCAPLLLWKIQVDLDGQEVHFSLREEGAEFNFALQAWFSKEKEHNISLEWESDNTDDLSALEGKIERALAVWKECKNHLNFTKSIRKFEKEKFVSDSPIIAPCAVIGQANFNGRRLLEELEELKELRKSGGDFGLLNRLLVDAGERAKTPAAKKPQDESEKWLVSESDAAQERAIWQARLEEVMLIEGPPGTGKSQTIVNLIADAALRGKQVALICDKKPALDIVRERLEKAGLGNLTAQIDEPAKEKERARFIQRVREISYQEILPDADERDRLSKAISESEEICEHACEKQGAAYSVRGHLRAQIHKAQESTGFSPFFEHADIVSKFQGALGDQLDQAQSDHWIEKAKSLVRDWQECDYPDNPWRDIKEHWDRGKIPSLQAGISGMRRQCENLAEKRQLLPHGAALSFAENPLMSAHLAAFVAPARREVVREFGRLIAGTRRAFILADLKCPQLWRGIFDRNGESGYARYERAIGQIETIQRVHRLLRERCLQILAENFSDQVSHWPEILLATICKMRYKRSPVAVGEFDAALRQLERSIAEKRMLDQREICRKYPRQEDAAVDLRRRNLLHPQAGGGIPKTPLRSIYHDEKKAIWSVFPILLTKPDAASELLPLRPGTLDLVIIDEASQMFTADAMPIFYRAKKIIVCGDDKQMPPSDNFNSARDNADDDSENGDSEDDEPEKPKKGYAPADGRFELLEAAGHFLLSRGKNARPLLEVHYRSLPNELIEFSNHAFYSGKLQTAPSNVDLPERIGKRPICVEECGGTFEDGVNQVEIGRIVEKLREIWRAPNPPSIGVIVFNVKQANALDAAIDGDTDLRAARKKATGDEEESSAPFFVRSVESVQGDERDIIILGTTYSRESKNFGLLSRAEKGRRRLNVAITRAKKGMFVFTSLGDNFSHHGEGSPNSGENPTSERWYLWMYMRYARAISTGNRKVAEQVLRELNPAYASFSTGTPDSEFEIQVANFLRGKGYAVDYQIGESGFRIDLGVKKDAGDVRYLCGIECDGRQYHSGWRARHNDIWRQDILEKKGWKIVRIWSDDWFDSPAGKEKLLAKIRQLEPGETA